MHEKLGICFTGIILISCFGDLMKVEGSGEGGETRNFGLNYEIFLAPPRMMKFSCRSDEHKNRFIVTTFFLSWLLLADGSFSRPTFASFENMSGTAKRLKGTIATSKTITS